MSSAYKTNWVVVYEASRALEARDFPEDEGSYDGVVECNGARLNRLVLLFGEGEQPNTAGDSSLFVSQLRLRGRKRMLQVAAMLKRMPFLLHRVWIETGDSFINKTKRKGDQDEGPFVADAVVMAGDIILGDGLLLSDENAAGQELRRRIGEDGLELLSLATLEPSLAARRGRKRCSGAVMDEDDDAHSVSSNERRDEGRQIRQLRAELRAARAQLEDKQLQIDDLRADKQRLLAQLDRTKSADLPIHRHYPYGVPSRPPKKRSEMKNVYGFHPEHFAQEHCIVFHGYFPNYDVDDLYQGPMPRSGRVDRYRRDGLPRGEEYVEGFDIDGELVAQLRELRNEDRVKEKMRRIDAGDGLV